MMDAALSIVVVLITAVILFIGGSKVIKDFGELLDLIEKGILEMEEDNDGL